MNIQTSPLKALSFYAALAMSSVAWDASEQIEQTLFNPLNLEEKVQCEQCQHRWMMGVDEAKKVLAQELAHTWKLGERKAVWMVDTVFEYALYNELDPLLVLAVIQTESGFKQDAINGQSYGLMQVNAKWQAELIGQESAQFLIEDPQRNIALGTLILARYIALENGSAYNGLRRYNGLGKHNDYPELVLSRMVKFERLLLAHVSDETKLESPLSSGKFKDKGHRST